MHYQCGFFLHEVLPFIFFDKNLIFSHPAHSCDGGIYSTTNIWADITTLLYNTKFLFASTVIFYHLISPNLEIASDRRSVSVCGSNLFTSQPRRLIVGENKSTIKELKSSFTFVLARSCSS